ncbi:hypothetical protein ETB97_002086 [Aspergillus alliaceus]|uniref:Uncharacterized protein n=1 Tax=Petromyces alliaceus TaxID=209559 RepID=A0A8H6A545_PETAA|nr:hypothetical protein ETB97_002086 [Aspergillus burnettii]
MSELTSGIWQLCESERVNLMEFGLCDRHCICEKDAITRVILARNERMAEKRACPSRRIRHFSDEIGIHNVAIEIIEPRLWQVLELGSCTPRDAIKSGTARAQSQTEQNINSFTHIVDLIGDIELVMSGVEEICLGGAEFWSGCRW